MLIEMSISESFPGFMRSHLWEVEPANLPLANSFNETTVQKGLGISVHVSL